VGLSRQDCAAFWTTSFGRMMLGVVAGAEAGGWRTGSWNGRRDRARRAASSQVLLQIGGLLSWAGRRRRCRIGRVWVGVVVVRRSSTVRSGTGCRRGTGRTGKRLSGRRRGRFPRGAGPGGRRGRWCELLVEDAFRSSSTRDRSSCRPRERASSTSSLVCGASRASCPPCAQVLHSALDGRIDLSHHRSWAEVGLSAAGPKGGSKRSMRTRRFVSSFRISSSTGRRESTRRAAHAYLYSRSVTDHS